jgi:hypothetical protein
MKPPEITGTRGAYSIDSFAAAHEISRAQTYIEIDEGRLKASKCGSRTLITVENAQAWRASLPAYEETPAVTQGAVAVRKPSPKQKPSRRSREAV